MHIKNRSLIFSVAALLFGFFVWNGPFPAYSAQTLDSAIFDASLKIPVCSRIALGCDSGALMNGRGPLGPEPSTPNTLYGSCLDGSSGVYHRDESVDRVKVYSSDGLDLRVGKQAVAEVTVWAYSGYTSDALDFYYTTDTTSPRWQLLGTKTPAGPGVQVMSTTFTLQPGTNIQAVRAQFRYGGAAAPCTNGAYNDRDDLAFGVGTSDDMTLPSVALTAPVDGSTVSGNVSVSASATDNVGVAKVEFYKGVTLLGTKSTTPYTINWLTTSEANGNYGLTAKAYDTSGNTMTSAIVSVNVSNSVQVPVLQNGPFEGGVSPWIQSGTTYYSSTSSSAHSGSGSIYFQPKYNLSGITYQTITVPSSGGTLYYWLSISTTDYSSSYDHIQIGLVGSPKSTYYDFTNQNQTNGQYVQKSIDLTSFAGQTIKIQFWGYTQFTGATIFRIDDVSIQ